MKKENNKSFYLVKIITVAVLLLNGAFAQGGRPPDHEPAYYNGSVVAMKASDWLPNRAPLSVQGNVFVVAYPIGWESMGLETPQCHPCDHAGNGIDFTDFHDHVLDALPSSPDWYPLKRVNVILPNYSFLIGVNDPVRDAAVSAAYAGHLPTTSQDDVIALLNSTAPDGSPLAIRIDAGFYIRVSQDRR